MALSGVLRNFCTSNPVRGLPLCVPNLKMFRPAKRVERTFRAGEMVPQAVIEKKDMQHTYREGDDFVFMDMETYEEVA
jgi:elongation factor P